MNWWISIDNKRGTLLGEYREMAPSVKKIERNMSIFSVLSLCPTLETHRYIYTSINLFGYMFGVAAPMIEAYRRVRMC